VAEQTFEWVQANLAEILEVPAGDVTLESRFGDDLDADSIDLIELVNKAEQAFGVTVEEQELYDLASVAELVALLDAKQSAS
jgi:acyl carrier protein